MKRIALFFILCTLFFSPAGAQTVRLDATKTYQHITGFGAFVCSPGFAYNHMSTDEIKRVWGPPTNSLGCNIMRLYIPIGKNSWGQSLATAKKAKELGLIVFASPWGQPAEWKTNGTSNAKNSDGTTGKLKRENWPDYAQYLEDYVQYLRNNGVELDAISIQNEPDWAATYAGCLWSASEIAEFVKTYGRTISCKIMAPETLGVSDGYANALNKSDVLDCFDIYGAHQYGGIQSAYKQLATKGKEIWMTEYLINWCEVEGADRDFNFDKDFFNFFSSINQCMLGGFNAWIHYTAKRYYSLLGDGSKNAGSSGTVTKRGRIMAHFARYTTGMTRIEADFGTTGLEGSAYLSQTGDTVVAVMANQGTEALSVTMDLPFYTMGGRVITTGKTKNLQASVINLQEESCRPGITVDARSVVTVFFIRSRDRQLSNMKGTTTRFNRIEDQTVTKSTFGTTYRMSNTTKKFDHSNALISSRTNTANGYVALADRYEQLVMHVNSVSSTMNYSSAKTTLTYVNAKGEVANYDYGDLDLNRRQNFDLVFDLSPKTLTDGCIGLISLTNNNWSSTLTISFGDVYLTTVGNGYAATLSGAFVADDSYVQEYTHDSGCTSLDMTACTDLPTDLPLAMANTNSVLYLPASDTQHSTPNVIVGSDCQQLVLHADGGDFHPVRSFQAAEATFSCHVDGFRLLMLPFSAQIPEGARAYVVNSDLTVEQMRSIPANRPVLVEGNGELTFSGQGMVTFVSLPLTDWLRGSLIQLPVYEGDYLLGQQDGQWGLVRQTESSVLPPFGVYAQPAGQNDSFLPLGVNQTAIQSVTRHPSPISRFSITGQRVSGSRMGLLIIRTPEGKNQKVIIK